MSTNVDNTAAGKTDHKRGFNVTAWSIEHPYTIWAFYLAMIILAFVAIGYYMPKRLMPYVQSPMIGREHAAWIVSGGNGDIHQQAD